MRRVISKVAFRPRLCVLCNYENILCICCDVCFDVYLIIAPSNKAKCNVVSMIDICFSLEKTYQLCLLINIAIIHGRPAENVALRRPLGLPFLESVFDKWCRHVIAKIKETHAALRQPFNERPDIFGERAVKFVSHEGYIKAVLFLRAEQRRSWIFNL